MKLSKSRVAGRFLIATVAAVVAATVSPAQTAEQIIAKARSYLGSEAALDAIHSEHFTGVLEEQDTGQAEPVKSNVEIILQKPYQELMIKTSPTMVETIGLDDLEAWRRQQPVQGRTPARVALLVPDMVRKLRADAWENLNFFKGIERRGGEVKVMGPAEVNGVATVKVAFIHDADIIFYRYFDTATGRLVLTETPEGGRIEEAGEMRVDGVRFPRSISSTMKVLNAQGQAVERRRVLTFAKVTVNETFPDSIFAVPDQPPPPEPSPPAPSAPAKPASTTSATQP